MKTFTELEQEERIDPWEVIDALENSARNGHPINERIVKTIIDRAVCSRDALRELLRTGEHGVQICNSLDESERAGSYQKVVDYVQGLLKEIE